MEKLIQVRLKKLLHYNPKTGIFVRLKNISNVKKGDVAGYLNDNGYRYISVDNKLYLASRLAFLYMQGYFPEHQIDHKNRIRNDDRWKNLRHVSRQCNVRNCSISKRNTSGITGVSWNKQKQKWVAHVMISRKLIHLGYFTSKFTAVTVRWEAEKKHNFPNCNTTSLAYLFLQQKELLR